MNRVFLSLGSNLEPHLHLRNALDALRTEFGEVVASPVYRFAAVGFEGPDFLNLAVAIDTLREPENLNDWLHALEDREGRRRNVARFSSRTLDIDIVLFGARIVNGPGHLQVPRDDLGHAFVLQPMADIAASVEHPVLGVTIAAMWEQALAAGSTPGELVCDVI